MTDIILMLVLVGLVGFYIMTVSKRKKKDIDMKLGRSENEIERNEVDLLCRQHHVNLLKEKTNRQVEMHLTDNRAKLLATLSYLKGKDFKKALPLAIELENKELQVASYELELEAIKENKDLDKAEKKEETNKIKKKIKKLN